jgi:aarF domain-containing kinase
MYILRRFAGFYDVLTGLLIRQPPYHVAIVNAFAGASYVELDYEHEGANQQRFRDAFAARGCYVKVPEVHWSATARKVLTSEWVDGVQLAQSPPAVINKLVPVGVECFLTQVRRSP